MYKMCYMDDIIQTMQHKRYYCSLLKPEETKMIVFNKIIFETVIIT